jgi:hypothetical protein
MTWPYTSVKDIKWSSITLEAYFSRPKVCIMYEYTVQDSVVWTAKYPNSSGERNLFSSTSIQTDTGVLPALCKMGTGTLS